MLPSRQNSINEKEEDEESDLFKSRCFLTRVYNKIITAQEISGPEVANVMLGQPESYTNIKFTMLNYDSFYLEMMMMFPHLQIKKLVEGTTVEPILNIVS